jgi:F0F1-type ATP synthase assembly protein I
MSALTEVEFLMIFIPAVLIGTGMGILIREYFIAK